MKKNFYFAALAGMLALSACSKDQEGTDGKQPTDALSSMTIKLESPKTYVTSTPVGNESKLTKTYVYVYAMTGDDGKGTPKYVPAVLGEGATQATVKFPVEGKTVFALANISDEEVAKVNAFTTEDEFKSYVSNIEKSYIGNLTQEGSFIMSGKAVVNNAAGTVPYILPITLNRDIAKTSFHVQKLAVAGTAPGAVAPTLNSVKRIFIVRGAAHTQPFNMDGANNTGYSLTAGYGQVGYVGDHETELLAAGKINNLTTTLNATDLTFERPYTNQSDDVSYIYDPFYVLPNYAQTAVRGTIVILEAEVTLDGTTTPVLKYYKARISDAVTTYDTRKNTHYIITATLKGDGSDKPDPSENEKDNLVVTIKVADWALVLSSQEIE